MHWRQMAEFRAGRIDLLELWQADTSSWELCAVFLSVWEQGCPTSHHWQLFWDNGMVCSHALFAPETLWGRGQNLAWKCLESRNTNTAIGIEWRHFFDVEKPPAARNPETQDTWLEQPVLYHWSDNWKPLWCSKPKCHIGQPILLCMMPLVCVFFVCFIIKKLWHSSKTEIFPCRFFFAGWI